MKYRRVMCVFLLLAAFCTTVKKVGLRKLESTSITNAAQGTFILDWLSADGTLM